MSLKARTPIYQDTVMRLNERVIWKSSLQKPDDNSFIDVEIPYRREFILSDDSPIGRKNRPVKAVFHTKWETTLHPYPKYTLLKTSTTIKDQYKIWFNPGEVPFLNLSAPKQPDVDKMAKVAVSKFLSDFSALTFIFEPLSFKKIKPKNLKQFKGKKFAISYDNPLTDFSSGSSAILSTTLGLLPFVSDLKAIEQRLNGWTKQLDRLHGALTRGIRQVFTDPQSFSHTYSPSPGIQVKVVGTAKTVWGIRFKGQISNDLRGPIKRFNFELSLATLWEFIPFSFVIDWLVPIGAALDRGTGLDNIQLVQSWYSRKIEYTAQVTADVLVPDINPDSVYPGGYTFTPGKSPEPTVIQTLKGTHYYREPMKFDDFDGIVVDETLRIFKFPSLNRYLTVLGLALAAKGK
jgi:hypothetical protein